MLIFWAIRIYFLPKSNDNSLSLFLHGSYNASFVLYSFNHLLIAPLAKTRQGVIYDSYFCGHRWAHFFIVLSATTLCKVTGYDLQLHLRYRNSIWISRNRNLKILFMHTSPVSFTGSYTAYESNFPRQKNLILQKMVLAGEEKVVN